LHDSKNNLHLKGSQIDVVLCFGICLCLWRWNCEAITDKVEFNKLN